MMSRSVVTFRKVFLEKVTFASQTPVSDFLEKEGTC